MSDKILYKVLCDDYEEVRRILFEIEETGEQIEGWYQIQKWVNSLFEENEKLKQFKDKTFDLLDKEIAKNEEAIEWGEKQGVGVGAMGFHTNMLKILRKELQE